MQASQEAEAELAGLMERSVGDLDLVGYLLLDKAVSREKEIAPIMMLYYFIANRNDLGKLQSDLADYLV